MAASASTAVILFFAVTTMMSLSAIPAFASDRLNSGHQLDTGGSLAQGGYLFIIQNDCNLVLYDNNRAVWASGTNGKASNCFLKMQNDGNLVIYSGSRAIWASNTNRQNGNYYLILQRDRNVVIYDNSNNAIWATHTNVGNAEITVIPHSNGTAAASGAAQNKVNELYISMY
uniref:Gastrodianin-MNF protein n=1 Tax=Gastrodia elata TaxID=91201 RepID=Q9LEK4_9ASPA|nr:gastrodianin-MNF protein [Gastrodia elata]